MYKEKKHLNFEEEIHLNGGTTTACRLRVVIGYI
jgi:hypothetical protein